MGWVELNESHNQLDIGTGVWTTLLLRPLYLGIY